LGSFEFDARTVWVMNAVADHRDICPQLERCFYDWNGNLPLIASATAKLRYLLWNFCQELHVSRILNLLPYSSLSAVFHSSPDGGINSVEAKTMELGH
jgi:hypothetical protein